MMENEKISREKFDLVVGPVPILHSKLWAMATFHGTGQQWVPSFADLYRIAKALAYCEEKKYPSEHGFDGGIRIYDFLVAAANAWRDGQSFDDLARAFNIPERDRNGGIVQANGARLDRPEQQPRLFEWRIGSGWIKKEWPK